MRSDKIESSSEYLTAAQVMQRYGNVSHMWIVRRMQTANFPTPVRLAGRLRFWRAADLEAWERKVIAAELKPSKKPRPAAR